MIIEKNKGILRKFRRLVAKTAKVNTKTGTSVQCTHKGCCLVDKNGRPLASGRVFTPRELKDAGFDLAKLCLSDPDRPAAEYKPALLINVYRHERSRSPYDRETGVGAARA